MIIAICCVRALRPPYSSPYTMTQEERTSIILKLSCNPELSIVTREVQCKQEPCRLPCSDRACTGDANMDGRLQLSFEGTLWHKPASKQAPLGRFNPWRKAGNRSQERVMGSQVPAVHLTSGNGALARQASVAESEETATDQPASVAVLQHSAHDSDVSLSSSLNTPSAGPAAARSVVVAEHEAEPSSSSSRECSFTALASPEEDGDRATARSSSTLHANARVWASVKLGPPLNVVPGFLISYTGGLIATAVLQALMPTVLELLGRDYETWAAGGGRKALR